MALTRDVQRRRARRAALLLGVVALLFYAAFIYLSVHRSHA